MKKMKLKALAILLIMVGVLILTALPASAAIPTGDSRVTSCEVNLRKTGSSSSTILAKIPKGTFLKIKGTDGNGWYKVNYKNILGYIQGTYLKNPFTVYGDKYSKYVLTDIQMRSTPSSASTTNRIAVIKYGSKVFVMGKVDGANWYKVWYGGKVGYIVGGYFKGDMTHVRYMVRATWIRSSQSMTAANKVKAVRVGKQIVLIGKGTGTWYKVRYGTYVGYMKSGYFSKKKPGSTTPSTSTGTTKTMTTSINMRSSRTTTSTTNIICVIPAGATVKIVASYSDNWYGVTYNGKSGYIKGGYFA